MIDHQILAAETASAAGSLVGSLFFPILGAVLLVVGLRKRRRAGDTPEDLSSAKRFITAGSVVLALGLFMLLVGAMGNAGR